MSETLRVGTRGSPLALAQTEEALRHLRKAHPGERFNAIVIKTHGDEGYREDLGTPLDGKSAFTKRIEDTLLDGTIDLAVHSLKDLPAEPVPGLEIAAVPPRADPRDVFFSNDGLTLERLPAGTRVGTSSLRRRAQLLVRWPELEILDLHGNVGTRLRRLREGDFDAIVVAAAGLDRLQVQDHRIEPLSPDVVTPAPGQGALALECRSSDDRVLGLLRAVDDPATRQATEAERALSARMGGSCNVPFGALGTLEAGMLHLRAVVAAPDGRHAVRAAAQASADQWLGLVDSVTQTLLHGGAQEILREAQR